MNISVVSSGYHSSNVSSAKRNWSIAKSLQIISKSSGKKNKNLFGFSSVEIHESMVTAIYGNSVTNGPTIYGKTSGSKSDSEYVEVDSEKVDAVELSEYYDKYKDSSSFYYHGEKISDYELIQTAVASGKMEMPADEGDSDAVWNAFNVLVRDEATAKYSWSGTLYSEDGKYTFTPKSNGNGTQMHLIQDDEVGASVEDIANWLASGIPARNIETRYIDYLNLVDPDLLQAAKSVGTEVRTYNIMEGLHMDGLLSENQNQYDIGLLGLMFGKNADDMRYLLNNSRNTGDFLSLLDTYQPEGAKSLANLRVKQCLETNGGVI